MRHARSRPPEGAQATHVPLIRLGRTGLHAAAQRRTPLVLAPLKNLHRIAWLPIQSPPRGGAARGGGGGRRLGGRCQGPRRYSSHRGVLHTTAHVTAALRNSQRDGRRGGCGSLSSDSRPWIEISLITTCALSVGPSLSHPPPPPRSLSVKGPRQAHTRARAHARTHARTQPNTRARAEPRRCTSRASLTQTTLPSNGFVPSLSRRRTSSVVPRSFRYVARYSASHGSSCATASRRPSNVPSLSRRRLGSPRPGADAGRAHPAPARMRAG
jgi:hypothetical protein